MWVGTGCLMMAGPVMGPAPSTVSTCDHDQCEAGQEYCYGKQVWLQSAAAPMVTDACLLLEQYSNESKPQHGHGRARTRGQAGAGAGWARAPRHQEPGAAHRGYKLQRSLKWFRVSNLQLHI